MASGDTTTMELTSDPQDVSMHFGWVAGSVYFLQNISDREEILILDAASKPTAGLGNSYRIPPGGVFEYTAPPDGTKTWAYVINGRGRLHGPEV